MNRAFLAIAAAALALLHTSGDGNAQSQAPSESGVIVFSPWLRFCLPEQAACLVTMDAKLQTGALVASVELFEPDRNSKAILRITFPLGMRLAQGTRIIVDSDQPISAPYVFCPTNGCKSDYAAPPQLIERLKGGKSLVIQAINAKGQPVSIVIPLAGFAKIHDGPPDSRAVNLSAAGDGDLLLNGGTQNPPYRGSLLYSPWTKFCLTGKEPNAKEVCFTGKDARRQDGTPLVAAVLIEPQGEEKKALRFTVQTGVSLKPGIQIKFDQSPSLSGPYIMCLSDGCLSDYAATVEIIDNLKTSKTLTVQATNTGGQRINYAIPLGDFAKAYDGPPVDPKVFEAQQKKLQDDLKRRAAAQQPRPQAVEAPTGGSSGAPDVAAVRQCLASFYPNTCGGAVTMTNIRQVDRRVTASDATVIAEIDFSVQQGFAGCSPNALNCTGTCWDMDPAKVRSEQMNTGLPLPMPDAGQDHAFFIGQGLRIRKNFEFQKYESGWRCVTKALQPVDGAFYLGQ
jgi:invasion protein IalB